MLQNTNFAASATATASSTLVDSGSSKSSPDDGFAKLLGGEPSESLKETTLVPRPNAGTVPTGHNISKTRLGGGFSGLQSEQVSSVSEAGASIEETPTYVPLEKPLPQRIDEISLKTFGYLAAPVVGNDAMPTSKIPGSSESTLDVSDFSSPAVGQAEPDLLSDAATTAAGQPPKEVVTRLGEPSVQNDEVSSKDTSHSDLPRSIQVPEEMVTQELSGSYSSYPIKIEAAFSKLDSIASEQVGETAELSSRLPLEESTAVGMNERPGLEKSGLNALNPVISSLATSSGLAQVATHVSALTTAFQSKSSTPARIELPVSKGAVESGTIPNEMRLPTEVPGLEPALQRARASLVENQPMAAAKVEPTLHASPKIDVPVVETGRLSVDNISNKQPVETTPAKQVADTVFQNLSQPAQTLAGTIRENSNWSQFLTSPTSQTAQLVKPDGTVLQTMRVQLNPVELGKVDLNLRMQQGQLQIEVRVQSDQALRALAVDQEALFNTLKGLGYKVDNIVISGPSSDNNTQLQNFGQQDEQRFQGEKNERRNSERSYDFSELEHDNYHEEMSDQSTRSTGNII